MGGGDRGHNQGVSRYQKSIRDNVRQLLASRSIRWSDLLTVTEAGSTAHGISVGFDDLDFTVVRIEPFEELVVGDDRTQSQMIRTKPEGERSEPGDIDLNVYTLRRFTRLAANGNPSILMILFAPEELRMIDDSFPATRLSEVTLSKRAGEAYLGYLRKQLEKWQGKASMGTSRPELMEAHGYDTKFAAHAIRLGIQGVEYLNTGRISLPMAEPIASEIRLLRAGQMPEAEALAWVRTVERDLIKAHEASKLPERADPAQVKAFLVEEYGKRSATI